MMERSFAKRPENRWAAAMARMSSPRASISSVASDLMANTRHGSLFVPPRNMAETSIPMNPFFETPSIEVEGVSIDTGRRNSAYSANYVTRESVYQPFRRVTLCWDTLNVFKLASEEKLPFMRKTEEVLQATDQLLRSLSGVVNAGDLVVVLGPKRSGKTLLLQALSGRLSSEDFSSDGKIYVNNQQADSDLLRFTSGYVPADYPFCGALTVKEHLLFQAYLRIEERYSLDEKAALVEDMIKEIGLSNCADFKIGIPGRLKSQVSLCEKRLLAFATESLTNPAVLCCDEPLAGLDAFEAEKVITFLKRMTQRGKIVIYAQTRPTSEAFGLSDKVAILHAGRSAFFGTTDEALDFFALSGFTCPTNCNPADHYVGSLVGSATLTDIERNEQTKFICDKYLVSNTLDKVRRKLENTSRMSRICTTAKTIKPKSAWRTSWTFQLSMLLWRGALCAWRDPFCITASFVFHVFTGLTIGIFFLQQDPHTQIGRDAINGVLLLIVCLLGVFPLLGALAISLPEYRQFQQESAEAICSVSAFSVSHCLLRLPQHICFSALLVTLSYWLVGLLPSAPAFLTACCVAALLSMVAESFFWLVTISTKGRGLTLTLSFLIGFPLFLLNGFLPRLKFVPGWLNWISYLSWFRYAMDALTCNQWRYMAHFWQDYPGSNFSHIGVGSDVTSDSIDSATLDSLTFDCGMLFAFVVAFHLLAFLTSLRLIK